METTTRPVKREKKSDSAEIQRQIVDEIRQQRASQSTFAPTTFGSILGQLGIDTKNRSVMNGKIVKAEVLISAKASGKGSENLLTCPIALRDDIAEFSESPALLDFAYATASAGIDARGFTISQLKSQLRSGKHKLDQHFSQALKEQTAGNTLPSSMGCVPMLRGSQCLFRISELRAGTGRSVRPEGATESGSVTSPEPSGPKISGDETTFASEFSDVFEQLDAASGRRNFVKLSALRSVLPQYSRDEFDRFLNHLRRQRLFSLDSSDGNRVSLSDEDVAAGIREGNSILIYCSRY